MNRRQLVIHSGIALLMLSRHGVALGRQSSSWGASLPASVSFAPITNPSSADLLRASQLTAIARTTWQPGAEYESPCFDTDTGGPEVVLVEQGILGVLVREPSNRWSESLPATNLPVAFLKSEGFAPITVVPESELELGEGEGIVFPAGSICRRWAAEGDGLVKVLLVGLLPGRDFPPYDTEDLGVSVEAFDVNFGARTLNPSAPPVIVAGRLGIENGGYLTLEEFGMPVTLCVESGEATLIAQHEGGLLRDASLSDGDLSTTLPYGEQVTLSAGQSVYLPASVAGTLEGADSATFMMVGVSIATIPTA